MPKKKPLSRATRTARTNVNRRIQFHQAKGRHPKKTLPRVEGSRRGRSRYV